jgi:hypothetical protein
MDGTVQWVSVSCNGCRRHLVRIVSPGGDEVICPSCWHWGNSEEVIVEGAGLMQPKPVSAKVKALITDWVRDNPDPNPIY